MHAKHLHQSCTSSSLNKLAVATKLRTSSHPATQCCGYETVAMLTNLTPANVHATWPCRGFCRHQVPGFGPWHRAYLRQFELALIQAARTAASMFEDSDLRSQYTSLAETIRLPYWDWTNPRVPGILTARTLTVLDWQNGVPTTIRNPFDLYQYTVREYSFCLSAIPARVPCGGMAKLCGQCSSARFTVSHRHD